MNSIIRVASRFASRSVLDRVVLTKPVNQYNLTVNKRWGHNQPLTYDFVRERILLTLRLFDKVDPEKVTLESHFVHDLGLDSLDQVEIIMHIEDEFGFEIPDKDSEKMVTAGHILRYITDHEEAYKELQDLQAHDHHGHGHDHGEHGHDHAHDHSATHSNHLSQTNVQPQTRGFCSWAVMSMRNMSSDRVYPTTFNEKPPREIKIEDIQARVMKVCSKYDKIDSSKLDLASHFVHDLGLDSLDHVEIMMELEDEFGLEIPDQDAEKLMRPAEVAKFIFHKEEARAVQPEDRQF